MTLDEMRATRVKIAVPAALELLDFDDPNYIKSPVSAYHYETGTNGYALIVQSAQGFEYRWDGPSCFTATLAEAEAELWEAFVNYPTEEMA